jgi:hypothetical protein
MDSLCRADLHGLGKPPPLFGDEPIRHRCTRSELFFALFADFASNKSAFGVLGAIGRPAVHAKDAKTAKRREERQKNVNGLRAGCRDGTRPHHWRLRFFASLREPSRLFAPFA